MLSWVVALLAAEVVVDVTAPGRTVPAGLFGTNLAARTQSTAEMAPLFRGFGLTLYRYPGGGSPGWHWETGHFDFPILERDDACALASLEAARELVGAAGGELLHAINLESGTPGEAAGLAAASGGRLFEIGNEAFGDWDRAYRGASQYAADLVAYANAIKAVQPGAWIGADMAGAFRDVDDDGDAVDTGDWDRVVLREAGASIDFLSYHWYPGRRRQEDPRKIVANSLRVREDVARFRRLIGELQPGRSIALGYLEWDGVFDHEQTGLRHSLANALFYADALGQMMIEGVELATHYEAATVTYGLVPAYDPCARPRYPAWDGATIRPKAFALQLASRLAGGRLLPARASGVGRYEVTTDFPLQEYAGPVPLLGAYAVQAAGAIRVLLVHRDPERPLSLVLRLAGAPAGPAALAVTVLSGPSLDATNEAAPGTVAPVRQPTRPVALPEVALELPPRAVVLAELIPGEPSPAAARDAGAPAPAPRGCAAGPDPGGGWLWWLLVLALARRARG